MVPRPPRYISPTPPAGKFIVTNKPINYTSSSYSLKANMAQSFPVVDYDSALKHVFGTHRPDGAKIDLKPLLDVIDKTLSRANSSINDALIGKCDRNVLTSQSVSAGSSVDAIGPLASIIHKISCELQCKCSGGDAHESTMVILKMLEKYEWDAKAVITIAAFAMNYGEFCLFAQLYLAHPLAKYVAILKHLPDIAEHGSTHQHLFGSIKGLVGAIVELAKVMDQFDDLNHKYISADKPPLSNAMAMIHEPVYWVIFSVVVCTEQIASLAGVSTEKTTSYPLANLTVRVNQVLKIVQKHLETCFAFIEEKKRKENYERVKSFFDNAPSQEDVLQAIFNWDKTTLIHCTGFFRKADKKVFHDKTVLILTSGLEITLEEITVLAEFYKKWHKERKSEQQTEIIWLPVIETGTSWDKCLPKFKELRGLMPWYTIEHPELIKEEVIFYIKQEWHFSGKTNLVALDSSGKVQSKNILDKLWMWGDSIFDFNETEEISLWEKSTNILELIFGRTGHTIDFSSVVKGKTMVCFYGGEDIEWIKKFTASAKKLADKSGLKIELTYVGKSTHLDKVKQNIKEITYHKISHTWSETTIWLFWTRLKSILYSSSRINGEIKTTLMDEITTLLTLDANETGWAVFCGGSTKLTKTKGEHALTVIDTLAENSAKWKDRGLISEVESHVETVNLKHCHLFFVDHEIQEGVPCRCGLTMKKSYVYKCCHGLH